jgi:DNA-binding response OmpR family regulator
MASPGTIAIAEDVESSRLILQAGLTRAGYTVLPARDGVEVLKLVEAGDIDLVILDVVMPELDGYATLKRLRLRFSPAQLPVIMLTGLNKAESVIEALRLGANDYAVKPVDIGVLLERVATHIKLKHPEAARIGPYELQKLLGSGAMGMVYAAVDQRQGTEVAVKVLPRSLTVQLSALQRFQREAALLGRIGHPNVVRFLETGQDGEVHYIVMELIHGASLYYF